MTAPAGPLDVVVIGKNDAADAAAAVLRRVGDVAVLTVVEADYSFDEAADRWLVRAADGREWRPRVVVLVSGASAATFLGVAAHGRPNLFFAETDAQAGYVGKCLAMLAHAGCTRIEVRAGVQHEFVRRGPTGPGSARRALRRPQPRHFDLTVPADREPPGAYRGPATLDACGVDQPVLVTLDGYRDPIDGRYHWHGRLRAADPDAALPEPSRAAVLLSLPGRDAVAARLDEVDPWGNLRVTGVGEPPFGL